MAETPEMTRLGLLIKDDCDPHELWAEYIDMLKQAHKDYDFLAFSKCTLFFSLFTPKDNVFTITTKMLEDFVPVAVDIVIDSEMTKTPWLLYKMVGVFMTVMMSCYFDELPSVTVSFDQIYKWYKRSVIKANFLVPPKGFTEAGIIRGFIRKVSMFFSEEDGDKIIDMFLHRIGRVHNDQLVDMLMFLPPSSLPKVIDPLINLMEDLPISASHSIICYFVKCMEIPASVKIDWMPYVPRIMHELMCAINPKIVVVDAKECATGGKKGNSSPHFRLSPTWGYMLAQLLCYGSDRDLVINWIDLLMRNMAPKITPKSRSEPIVDLIASFAKMVCLVFRMGVVPGKLQWLTESQREKLADILVSVIRQIIATLSYRVWDSNFEYVAYLLSCLSHTKTYNEIFLYAIDNLEDPEEGQLSQTCKAIMCHMIPVFMSGEHTKDTLHLVPKIFDVIMPTLHSTIHMNKSSKLSYDVINAISALFYIDPKAEKLGIRERMVVNTYMSHFDECLMASIATSSSFAQQNDEIDDVKHRSYIKAPFFNAYSTEFIDSKLTWLIEKLGESHPNSSAFWIVKSLVSAHPSLVNRVITLLIGAFRKSSREMQKFWSLAIGAACIMSPGFMDAWALCRDFIKEILASNEEDILRCVKCIIRGVMVNINAYQIPDSRCAPIESNIANMWGRVYDLKDLNPHLYRISDEDVRTVVNCILEIVEPLYAKFESYKSGDQGKLVSILALLASFTQRLGGIVHCSIKEFKEGDAKIYYTLLDIVRALLKTSANDDVKTRIFTAVKKLVSPVTMLDKQPTKWNGFIEFSGNKARILALRRHYMFHMKVLQMSIESLLFIEQPQLIEFFINDIIGSAEDSPALLKALRKLINDSAMALSWETIVPFINKMCDIVEANCMKNEKLAERALSCISDAITIAGVRNMDVIKRITYMFITLKYNPASKIDKLIGVCVDQLHRVITLSMSAASVESAFSEIQNYILTLERGNIPELWYIDLVTTYARKHVVSLSLFQYLWNTVISNRHDFRRTTDVMYTLLNVLRMVAPKPEKIICDHYPYDEYMINEDMYFTVEPKSVKIKVGPAIYREDYKYAEIRDWIRTQVTSEMIREMARSLSMMCDKPENVSNAFTLLWIYICDITGPSIIEAVASVTKEESDDIVYSVCLGRVVCGIAKSICLWDREDANKAIDQIIMPFVRKYVIKNVDASDMLSYIDCIFFGTDYRMHIWVLDMLKEIGFDQPEVVQRNMLTCLFMYVRRIHPAGYETLSKFVREVMFPPEKLVNQSKSMYQGLSSIVNCIMKNGLAKHERYDFNLISLPFEIISADADRTHIENTTAVLENLEFTYSTGSHRVIDYMSTDIIVKLFQRRDGASLIIARYLDVYYRNIPTMSWYMRPDKLLSVFTSLMECYPTAPWIIRTKIMMFMHLVCFHNLVMMDKSFYVHIFKEILPVFLQDDKVEIRDYSIRFARMLIHMRFDSLNEFYEEISNEKNKTLATAYSVVLLGATSVISGCPEWLPDLMMNLEDAHRSVVTYSKAIYQAFTDFWARAGPREIPEVEDFRYCFSHGYFA